MSGLGNRRQLSNQWVSLSQCLTRGYASNVRSAVWYTLLFIYQLSRGEIRHNSWCRPHTLHPVNRSLLFQRLQTRKSFWASPCESFTVIGASQYVSNVCVNEVVSKSRTVTSLTRTYDSYELSPPCSLWSSHHLTASSMNWAHLSWWVQICCTG